MSGVIHKLKYIPIHCATHILALTLFFCAEELQERQSNAWEPGIAAPSIFARQVRPLGASLPTKKRKKIRRRRKRRRKNKKKRPESKRIKERRERPRGTFQQRGVNWIMCGKCEPYLIQLHTGVTLLEKGRKLLWGRRQTKGEQAPILWQALLLILSPINIHSLVHICEHE